VSRQTSGARKAGTHHKKAPAARPLREAQRDVLPPFERGRAEPPVPITDDLDDSVAPPLPGKLHPPEEMGDATPTLDDEHRSYHHHPNDAGSVGFGFHPEAADAAADLAGDLGSTFLEGATRGEDMSDFTAMMDDRGEDELPLVLDEDADEPVEEDSFSRPQAVRARPFEEPGALGQSSARRARPADESASAARAKRAKRG
jgi:hypothetical protein